MGDAALKHGSDYVMLPPYSASEVNATSDLVFVGYGVVSEELKRDDLAGLDVKGKIVVLLNGQPTSSRSELPGVALPTHKPVA